MRRLLLILALAGSCSALALPPTGAAAAALPEWSFAAAKSDDPSLHYTVSLFNPEQHLLHIRLELPPGSAQRELQMPVWDALYQVRDFSQYINWLRATSRDGHPLQVEKIDKSRWRLSGSEGGASVSYEIYADNAGPFGAQLNAHHAFLNLAEVLIFPVDARAHSITLTFDVPDEWRIATALASDSAHEFHADTYDRLVDAPIEIGDFAEKDFTEGGTHYRVIVDADASDYDMGTLASELRKIVAAATGWMDDRPCDHYVFIYHFPRGPAGGGMEHAYSTAIDLNAEALKSGSAVLTGVTAHEFFHLWNVKRIRPRTIEPVDYARENYTRALWFSEGVTSTAGEIIELRAGLLDSSGYFYHLGEEITELERRPAHLTQSAEESSVDAWLEGDAYYRRPERSISYYNKGELLGVLLDLSIREASRGQASLRELFQWMNQTYAHKGRYFADSDGVREAANAVSHADLGWFFDKYVAGTEEIPWNQFFATVGLKAVPTSNTVPDPGFVSSRNFDGPLVVDAVTAGGEAERAGLRVGDTVVEFQGKPAAHDTREQIARLTPGDALSLKVHSRRGGERSLSWKVGARQETSYELVDLEPITPEQRARRSAWLKGEAQSARDASRMHSPATAASSGSTGQGRSPSQPLATGLTR